MREERVRRMSVNLSHDDLGILMLRQLEGLASIEEARMLSAALRESPAARRHFAILARQHAQLFEITEERRVVVSEQPQFEVKRGGQRWFAWAALLALVAALAAFFASTRLDSESATASVESWQGEVRFVSESGQGARPTKPILAPGASVETMSAGSWVGLGFSDGTRVDVDGNSRLDNVSDPHARGRKLHLRRGMLEAVVARVKPDVPLILTTPEAEAIVLGTELRLSTREGQTRLEVQEGTVQVRRLHDDARVTLTGGQFVLVSLEGDLQVLSSDDRQQQNGVN